MITSSQIRTVKENARAVWAMGDYQRIADLQLPIAARLCGWAEVTRGDRVLDIGTATGNVAITAARAGADVIGVDITPQMLDLARSRTAHEDVHAEYRIGDAEELPFADEDFDVVLSACGAWFAPRPELVAAEARRVLRPGGRLAFANFTPGGYMGRVNELITRRIPLPADMPEPNLWGTTGVAAERLADFISIEFRADSIVYEFDSPRAATEFFLTYSPPHVAASAQLDPGSARQLFSEIEQFTAAFLDRDGVKIEAEYLMLRARRPAGDRNVDEECE